MTRRPSVTGVELAWLLLVWRLVVGAPIDGGALPQDLSGRLVQAVDLPLVRRQVVHRLHVAIQPGLEAVVAGAADRGGREHAVAPHDRARGGDAGNRRLPLDVLAARDVPLGDRALAVAVAGAAVAAERRPVARTGGARDRRGSGAGGGAGAAAAAGGRSSLRRHTRQRQVGGALHQTRSIRPGPARSLNVSVAFTSTTRKTFSARWAPAEPAAVPAPAP